MECTLLPLSHVEWLYIQWAQHYTGPRPVDDADGINLLLALPIASIVHQRQTWGRKAPSFGSASYNIDTFVTL